jgi:hypothetical protein
MMLCSIGETVDTIDYDQQEQELPDQIQLILEIHAVCLTIPGLE